MKISRVQSNKECFLDTYSNKEQIGVSPLSAMISSITLVTRRQNEVRTVLVAAFSCVPAVRDR